MDFLSNVARKLAKCRQKIFWRHLANGQKLAIFKGKSLMNWTFCQMSPENWQNVARKFSGDIWQMAKKLYHYLANGQKIIPLLFAKLSPENWQIVARKFSGDIWQMSKIFQYVRENS
jgi:hypothetical protein